MTSPGQELPPRLHLGAGLPAARGAGGLRPFRRSLDDGQEAGLLPLLGDGLLVVLDDRLGLRRVVREVFGGQAVVQRCVWHKRENVVAYLPKHLQPLWRARLQRAYHQPTSAAAQAELQRLHQDLRRLNEDAARSLAEGLEDTLTLHRLGVVDRLGASLATTSNQ